ncbi:hypothetical protein V1512DRAFT_258954 [Lipomyces arxii]|uniref:uncharacterized protein n=1 Tax=Lipomyces arxii TaxID=56418 RepID=UPI0034CE0A54
MENLNNTRMRRGLIALITLALTANALSFQSVDSVYLHTTNNTFFRVSATIANASLASNLESGAITQLSSPPLNSLITPANDSSIYAFYGSCGSPIKVAQYNTSVDVWSDLSVTNAPMYHQGSSLFTDPASSAIYVFGGACPTKTSSIYYNSLCAFNPTSHAFSIPSNPNPPVPLRDAVAVTTNTEVVLFGGMASAGWIGMNQLAVFDSEWSYTLVADASAIDSRTDPILAISEDKSLIVLTGGYVDGRHANPNLLMLNISQQAWAWETISFTMSYVQAIAILKQNVILALTNATEPDILLIDINNWSYVSSFSTNHMAHSSTLSPGSIAAISTSTVLAVLLILASVMYIMYRRRNQRRTQGSMTPDSNDGVFLWHRKQNSTGSATSWEERRRSWLNKYSDPNPVEKEKLQPSDLTASIRTNLRSLHNRRRSSTSVGLGVNMSKTVPPAEADEDIDELFRDREVQVLVSTTRRSKLRITNPDPSTVIEEQIPQKMRWLVGDESLVSR